MNCPKCGAANRDGVKFCVSCGNSMPQTQQAITPAAVQRQGGQQGQYAQPPLGQGGNQQPYGQAGQQYRSQPSGYGSPRQDPDSSLTFGNWMITLLLISIPIVNIVMLFIWGFGDTTAPAKRNFAKAQLVWTAIAIVIEIIAFAVMYSAVNDLVETLTYSMGYSNLYSSLPYY